MAIETHSNKLREGPGAWNAWRKRHPAVIPDFVGENLIEANLIEANLYRAQLNGANLYRAQLNGADLRQANLRQVDLSEVDLVEANFTGANLTGARLYLAQLDGVDLTGANLRGADLRRADLTGARLAKANLAEAQIEHTSFVDVDLLQTRGLNTCRFYGPCLLDQHTLAKSGPLPIEFMRRCGLSDWQIEAAKLYNPKLTPANIAAITTQVSRHRSDDPLQIHNLFISYSYRDAAFIDQLEPYLHDRKIRYWHDIQDIPAGQLEAIEARTIRQNPVVLLIFSAHSSESDWLEREIESAGLLEKKLVRPVLCPIALDDTWEKARWSSGLLNQLNKYHVLDFSGWQAPETLGQMVDRLMEGLDLFYQPLPAPTKTQ